MGELTDRSVKTAREGRHGDGDGLHLVVSKTGRRKWVFRYQIDGARRDMGLGSYPAVSLSDARIATADARKLIAQGKDPLAARREANKAEKPIPTFKEIADLVVAEAKAASTNAKVQYQWERHLGPVYSGPLLERPVNEITTVDIADLLRPIWREKPEVARKLYPAIRRVFEQARIRLRDDHGIIMAENPAKWDDLKAIGFKAPKRLSRGHHPSLPYRQISSFVTDLRTRAAITALMLEYLILTNARTGAVLEMQWPELDEKEAVWTVPLASLKDREYREEPLEIPLSDRAIEIIGEMKKIRTSNFVFPSAKADKPLSNMAMLTLLKRMNSDDVPKWIDPVRKRPITAHGFRSTFRTWAEEATGFPQAVIEEAMGHQIGTDTERAYRRTNVLEKRRILMQDWANFCSKVADANVLPMRAAR